MRIPGTSFSDTDNLREAYSETYSIVEAYNILNEWSRYAIDVIKAQPHEANSDFHVLITLNPNPTDYKGEDDMKVEIWRSSRNGRPERNLVIMSEHRRKIADCIIDINARLAEIIGRTNNPDIVERNGKKYRLVEIK